MESCVLSYIPERLHSNDKPDIHFFDLGEFLFHRCKQDKINDPFDGIRLYDLSTNREGKKEFPLSFDRDVLYNMNPSNGKGEWLDDAVITLEIKELSANLTYEKTILQEGQDGNCKPITHNCYIRLLHDKLPCNYSHCIFKITLNGMGITRDNWNTTLGKRTEAITELRTKCKIEFEKMIIEREVRMNWG